MPLHSTSNVIRCVTKVNLLIVILLFSVTGLIAQDAIYLKNRWTREYMTSYINPFIKDPTPKVYLLTGDKKGLWYIERVDDTWVRLKDKDGLYLNVEKGVLEISAVPPGFFSAHWKLPVVAGYNQIINRWTGVYIHNQYNTTQATKAEPGWHSAQWSMEDKDGKPLVAKDFSLNSYTSLLPHQQMYYKFESVKYDPAPVFLDINKTRSSELVNVADYGGDNSGKAWKFTLVSDGWYKISNLKLGGNKVLAVAKNTDGSFYFVLTDFVNYPNQLWRMIQFKDQTLLKFVTEFNVRPEAFTQMYYTLVSKQHGLEAIKAMANTEDNPRILGFGINAGVYVQNPFDMFWRVKPIDDIAAIKNIPLSLAEQNALVKESVDKSMKIFNDAVLKSTPIAVSPFKPPVGRIKGEQLPPGSVGNVGGRDLSAFVGKNETEYTQEQWDWAVEVAGKIPMSIQNNTYLKIRINISYTDQFGQAISRNYVPIGFGEKHHFYLDPMCTFITFTGTDANSGGEVYKSTKFYRSKGVRIHLGGTKEIKETIWDW